MIEVKTHISLFIKILILIIVLFSSSENKLQAQCDLNIGANVTICNGGSALLGGATTLSGASGAITSYQWTTLAGAPSGSGSTLLASPGSSTSYVLTVTAPGCASAADTVLVNVAGGPCPTAQFTLPSGPVCDETSINVTNTTTNTAGNTYLWVWGDGSTSTGQNPGSHVFNIPPGTGTQVVTVTLIVTNAAGRSDAVQQNITIREIPDPPLISSNSLVLFNGVLYLRKCTSTATSVIAISDNTPNNAWIQTYSVDWGDGTPVWTSPTEPGAPVLTHVYSTGSYTLTYTITSANGCFSRSTYPVFIGNTPSIGLNGVQVDTCAAYTASYQISSVSNNVPGTYYEVTYNDGSPLVTYNHPPPASFTHTFTSSSCGNSSPNYSNAFYCTIKAINPCGEQQATIEPIRISTPPVADFTINPNPACVNSVVSITNTADPGEVVTLAGCTSNYKVVWNITPATGWTLSSGIFGSTNSTVYSGWTTGSDALGVTFTTAGNYQITQRIGNSFCGDDVITKTVCVVNPIVADFTTTANGFCAPVIITTDNLSTSSGCAPPVYQWSISPTAGFQTGNANAFEPSFLLTNDGTYTVTLTTTNACGTSTDNVQYVVVSPPTVSINAILAGCAPYTVDPSANYDAGGGVLNPAQWTFQNGSPATFTGADPGNITFNTAGSNTISVSVSNQCATANASISVFVSSSPQINLPDFNVCSGVSSLINGGNSILNPGFGSVPFTYNWTGAGGTSNAANPNFSFTNPGTTPIVQMVDVTVTDSIGCASSASVDVTVLPTPVLSFQSNLPSNGTTMCFGDAPIELTASSNVPGTNFNWTPNSGISTTTGNQVLVNPDTTVTYVFSGQNPTTGCTSTFPVTITVNQLPIVDAGVALQLCAQAIPEVLIPLTPLGGIWIDPTPATGTLNPNETYIPGLAGSVDTLVYTFTDANGCINADILPISVISPAPPQAGTDSALCLNATPFELDQAIPVGGVWSGPGIVFNLFGDSLFNPALAGVGVHELIYTIGVGTTCETKDTIEVEVWDIPQITIPIVQEICSGDTIDFESTATGGLYPYTWQWFPVLWVVGSSSDSVVTMVPQNPSNSDLFAPIIVELRDSHQCFVTDWFELIVHPLPAITAGPDTSICFSPQTPYVLNGFSPTTGNISWSSAPTNLGTLNGLNYQSGGLGTDSLFFRFTDANGCTNYDTLIIQITSPITINAGTGFNRCISAAPVNLPMAQPTNPPATYTASWNGPGVSGSGNNWTFDPSAAGAGLHVLTYIYETGATCAASDTIQVRVGSLPVVNAGANTGVCQGLTVQLNATVAAGSGTAPFVYNWTPAGNLSGTTITNPVFQSSAATVGTATYTFTVTDAYGCSVNDQIEITTNALPTVSAPNYTFCDQPIAETLTGATPAGGSWSSIFSGLTSAGVFTPNGIGSYNITYEFTDANGCLGIDNSVVNVDVVPTVSIGLDQTVCDESAAFSFTPSYVSTSSLWTGSISQTGVFTPTTVGSFPILFATGEGSCRVRDSANVTVNPLPPTNAGPPIQICNNVASIQISGESPTSGGTWIWTGTGITNGNLGTFDPNGLTPGSYTIYYQFTQTSTGCSLQDSTVVTVNEPSPVSFTDAQLNFCLTDYENNLSLVGVNPAGGVWTGTGVDNTTGTSVFVAPSVGTVTLTYTFTNPFGCVSSAQIPAVIGLPQYAVANNGLNASFCEDPDTTYQLTGSPLGGSWVFPAWINSSGSFSGAIPDTSIAVYSIGSLGCQTWDTVTVSLNALPTVKAGFDQSACLSSSCVQLEGFLPATNNGLTPPTGNWTGSGSISNGGVFCPTLSGVGIHELFYTFTQPQTGCVNRDSLMFTVHPEPQAIIILPAAYCLNSAYNLSNGSIGDTLVPGPFTSEWTIIDPASVEQLSSNAFSPNFTFDQTGVYTLNLTVTTAQGCIDSVSQTIQSVDLPVSSFTISADSGCAPMEILITNTSSGFAPSYLWAVDGVYSSTSAVPDTVFLPAPVLSDTNFVITVDVQNLCGTTSYELPVFSAVSPTPSFTVNSPSGCSPFIPVFNNISYGQPLSFVWNTGDGFTTTDFNLEGHAFIAINNDTTVYPVQLIAINDCRVDTMTMLITALPNTVTSFFNTDPPWGCAPLTVDFTNISAGSTDYLWDFGDGSALVTSEDAVHTYTSSGLFSITLISNDACSIDTSYAQVNVFAKPNVSFTLTEDAICLGTTVDINNLSTGAVAYSWSFGNGESAVGFQPPYLYPADGVFQIQLIGFSPVFGCPDTTTQFITVQEVPQINITANPVAGCMPLNVDFFNATAGSTSVQWDFDNGQTSAVFAPSTVYTLDGLYEASIVANSFNFGTNLNCPAQETIEIAVFPKPTSSFTLDAESACGPPASVNTENLSAGGFSYLWSWDNQISLLYQPQLSFSDTGLKNISLVVSNNYSCSDTTIAFFNVIGQPVARIQATPPVGCSPLTVNLEAISPYGDTWEWDFGDGQTGTGGPDIEHIYENPGTYDVYLRITSQDQCSDDTLAIGAVVSNPSAIADFTITPEILNGYSPLATFENLSQGASSYIFDTGDGAVYPDFIDKHVYSGAIIENYVVTLIANNAFNCLDTLAKILPVDPATNFWIPNSFTPNGDGNNEVFGPIISGNVEFYNFIVYDRWGHLVFETFDRDIKWDGTMFNNGKKPLKQDVYVYKIIVRFEPGTPNEEIFGRITLIY